MAQSGAGLHWCAILSLYCVTVLSAWAAPLRLAVVAPAPEHLIWDSARLLQRAAEAEGLNLRVEPAPGGAEADAQTPEMIVMPVRSLAGRIPALEILELPFFFANLYAVHKAVDGELGKALRDIARQHDWEILAFWDEGLHMMSGLRRYDRVANLKGMEFLLTRPDPVAERQFHAWRATPRTIRQADRDSVLRECLIASRAATLQEIQREELERVHMTLALTGHRYEGWLLLAPAQTWAKLPKPTRDTLTKILPQVTRAQRTAAARREVDALESLHAAGFMVHEVAAPARQAFIEYLPPWGELLSKEFDSQTRQRLLALGGINPDSSRLQTAPPAPATTP